MSNHKKMNPEVKKVWINELRSGRYRQTDGALRKGRSYCCLGVLCDLSKAAKWTPTSWGEGVYDGSSGILPFSVGEWADLSDGQQGDLAEMNDNGATFAEIADWIEKHL